MMESRCPNFYKVQDEIPIQQDLRASLKVAIEVGDSVASLSADLAIYATEL